MSSKKETVKLFRVKYKLQIENSSHKKILSDTSYVIIKSKKTKISPLDAINKVTRSITKKYENVSFIMIWAKEIKIIV